MKEILFKNAVFHSMKDESDVFSFMTVSNGKITGTYCKAPEGQFFKEIDLGGRHVYPCLIDGHTHMLYTIVIMAMGFNICEVTSNGVKPDNLHDIELLIRNHCEGKPEDAVIAANNYVITAIRERRLPSREELDIWSGNRAVVVYTIDGHSTALSSRMLEKIGINPVNHSGILQGEENERNQGKLTDVIASNISISTLAKGIANFHNACAGYGICMVGALEGNGDSKKDLTTALIVHLARHFGIQVRFYLQYMDLNRVKAYSKYFKHKRCGGCGDYEMDGSVGSHSAAFRIPYKDTNTIAPCYYDAEYIREKVIAANSEGYQVASHAIGDAAIDLIVNAMNSSTSGLLNRIEHIEFINEDQLKILDGSKYAVFMQPGYSWIDKRYLNTYSSSLDEKICTNLKLKSIMDTGVIVCGSSDSPVQAMDPYLQMLGMVDFYNEKESVSNFEALKAYTVNPAIAMNEFDSYGTLEEGKTADFFISDSDFLTLDKHQIASFRPHQTYYSGKPYSYKNGSVSELIRMLLSIPHKV